VALAIAQCSLIPVYAAAQQTEILASGTFTASGNSAPFQVPTASQLVVGVTITAVSGTSPLLDAWIQVSTDKGTTWYDMPADLVLLTDTTTASSTPVARRDIVDASDGTSTKRIYLGVYKDLAADRFRLKWIISGTTPSFTFSASVVAK
jgi:hypothetical protein